MKTGRYCLHRIDVMPPATPRTRAKKRPRCARCGQFIGKSDGTLCSSCLTIASIDPEPDVSDATAFGAVPNNRGRKLFEHGLDVGSLSLRVALLRRARHDSSPPSDLPSRPMLRHAGTSKSVLTFIGPVAAARRAAGRSRGGRARRLWVDVRAAHPIAMEGAVICLCAALGASIAILLSLFGP